MNPGFGPDGFVYLPSKTEALLRAVGKGGQIVLQDRQDRPEVFGFSPNGSVLAISDPDALRVYGSSGKLLASTAAQASSGKTLAFQSGR